MVLLSLWVGISLLPRLNAGGRGCGGRAGRRGGLRCPSLFQSRGCRLLTRPLRPRRGPKGRLAGAAGTARLLPPPGPSTPPRFGPSHLARSKGPHSGGGRAQPSILFKEPQRPAEPFLRGLGKGERGWETLAITSNRPGGRLSWTL